MLNSIRFCGLSAILAGSQLSGFYARIAHDTANADGARQALSQSIEIDEHRSMTGFLLFARREQILRDRTLTNALVLATANAGFPGHIFQFGLGTHFRQQALTGRMPEPGLFAPAVGLVWNNAAFRGEVSGAEKFTRATLSVLTTIGLPIEFNSEFENAFSQPFRFSANAFVHVSGYAGFIAGYEPLARQARAGLWIRPIESLAARFLARLSPQSETQWEFSLSYQAESDTATYKEPTPARVSLKEERRQKKPRQAPAFSTLVKWGLTPVEALRFAREKDICKLSAAAQNVLSKHHWKCRTDA